MSEPERGKVVLRRVGPVPGMASAGSTLAADNQLAAALVTFWHELSTAGVDTGPAAGAARPELSATVADLIQGIRAGRRLAVAATAGNELAGLLVLTTGHRPGRPGLGEVDVLLADPERGTLPGVLLRAGWELAAGAGVRALLAEVVAGGPQHQLFLEQGFREYGRLPGDPDTVLLRRDLTGGGDVVPTAIEAGFVELSHPITDGMVTYPGIPAPRIGSHLTFEESASHYAPGTEFSIGTIALAANTGTYLDTPAHRYRGAADLAGLPLASIANLEGLVVDPGPLVGQEIDRLPVDATVIAGRAVLIRTGHSAHWGTDRYFSEHPHLGIEAVSQLIDGGAALVGIDSLNIDGTSTGERPAHSGLLAAGIPIVEHLTALDRLPAAGSGGFRFFATPPLITGLATFPVRAFAIVEGGVRTG